MKFLIDAQLPTKLCEILGQFGFESKHVNEILQGDESSDQAIAKYADLHDFILITKDYDFYHSHMVLQTPQKLLLVNTGNIKNNQLFSLIRNNFIIISNSLSKNNFVELSNGGIIQHP